MNVQPNRNNRSEKCRQFHNVRHPLVQSPSKKRRLVLRAYVTETDCAEDRNTVKNLSCQQFFCYREQYHHSTY